MPSRIMFENAAGSRPPMPRSTPSIDVGHLHSSAVAKGSAFKDKFLKDRKPRGLSRFLRKLHIVSHPKAPKSTPMSVWTDNASAMSSSQPSSISSSSRGLSSEPSSSGNSIQHAIGLALISTSSLGSSQSGSEYSLTKVKHDFNSLLPHLQNSPTENVPAIDISTTPSEHSGTSEHAYESSFAWSSPMKRTRLRSPAAIAVSGLQVPERAVLTPSGLVPHLMVALDMPLLPAGTVAIPHTPIDDRQAFLTPEDSLLLGASRADLAAPVVEEDQDDFNDLDSTFVIDCSVTFPTNWVEGLLLMLQTDFLGMSIEQINEPAVEFGPFPLPRWMATPGGSLAVFIALLALYMHLP